MCLAFFLCMYNLYVSYRNQTGREILHEQGKVEEGMVPPSVPVRGEGYKNISDI